MRIWGRPVLAAALWLWQSSAWAAPLESLIVPFQADPRAALAGFTPVTLAARAARPQAPAAELPAPFSSPVLEVYDADTLRVRQPNNQELILRLQAVDAPEISHTERGSADVGQPYGDEAKNFVLGLVQGREVQVQVVEIDRYGRSIAWVYFEDGTTLQERLLRGGYAWWYFFYNHDTRLNDLENAAQAEGRGLWAGRAAGGVYTPEAPWVYRRRIRNGIERILPNEDRTFEYSHLPDADTVALGTRNSVYDYIRLAGIDAPEVAHGRPRPAQPFAVEAAERARELVEAEGATIRVKAEDTDPYGRLVGWVWLQRSGRWLNEVLVEEGLAWWYERYYPHLTQMRDYQLAAQARRIGIWSDPNPVPPWEHRRIRREPETSEITVQEAE